MIIYLHVNETAFEIVTQYTVIYYQMNLKNGQGSALHVFRTWETMKCK